MLHNFKTDGLSLKLDVKLKTEPNDHLDTGQGSSTFGSKMLESLSINVLRKYLSIIKGGNYYMDSFS